MKNCLWLGLIAGGLSVSAFADTSNNTAGTAPDKSALEAALAACASSAAKDSSGRPEMSAMDGCMSAKGFSKPTGTPHGQGNPPSPPPAK